MYFKVEKRDLKYRISNSYFNVESDEISHDDVPIYVEEQTKEIFEDIYGIKFKIEKMGEIGLDKLLTCATHLQVTLDE